MSASLAAIRNHCDRDDGNAFINFALYAVLGKMAEADDLMRKAAAGIKRVASLLDFRFPVRASALYRGMLVDPATPIVADHRYTFISWSEDRDVACWFASPGSVISRPLADSNARLRGVVLELAKPTSVLLHHSWASDWDRLALRHPHMGEEGARQIRWSLATQREVITLPLERLPDGVPVESVATLPVAELDGRLAPPWIQP